jgi:predicted RNase H-like HicB family nuclease
MNAKDGEQVDHINRNRLDNRKCNLRIVTNSQNNMNVPAKKNNKLGYKGVYRSTDNNSWVACLRYEGKLVLNKRFKTLEEALKARKEAEEIYFGEYNYRENNENKN